MTQVALLVQYVLNLAKYDMNYDIRDRARYFRTLINNNEKCPLLAKHLKKIVLAPKPAPVLESIYKECDQYQLGTLSHAIGARVNGYSDLPEFPGEAPDPTVRNVEVPVAAVNDREGPGVKSPKDGHKQQKKDKKREDKFYSDDESESQSTEGADPTNDEDEEESSSSESKSSDTEENTDKTVTKKKETKAEKGKNESKKESSGESGEDSSDSGSDSGSGSESSSDSEESTAEEKDSRKKPAVKTPAAKVAPSKWLDSNSLIHNYTKCFCNYCLKESVAAVKKVTETEDDSESDSDSESNTESSESKSESESDTEKTKASHPTRKAVNKREVVSVAVAKKIEAKPVVNKEISLLDLDCKLKSGCVFYEYLFKISKIKQLVIRRQSNQIQ